MFFQPPAPQGSIEVITGCMFSGKTQEMIARIMHARADGIHSYIFKPEIDIRYHTVNIMSHNAQSLEAIPVKNATDILNFINQSCTVGIDEAQFFDEGILGVCHYLASLHCRVIVAGLDMDFMGRPFGSMPGLLATADYVSKLQARCMVCGEVATRSFKKTNSSLTFELGETNLYEARCRRCFEMGIAERDIQIDLF